MTRGTIGSSSFLDAGVGSPAAQPVEFHNEMAYSASFPECVSFALFERSAEGGVTLLCDNEAVSRQISTGLRARLSTGVRYIRVLHDEAERSDPTFYSSWQGAFECDRLEDAFATASASECGVLEWQDGSTGRGRGRPRLRHTLWAPTSVTHPRLGALYFGSILNRHAAACHVGDAHPVFGQLAPEERPYQCVWADGAPLSAAELTELRELHASATIEVPLKSGELVVIDNLRLAHGRTPYRGRRTMGLLLGRMVQRDPRCQPPAVFAEWREQRLRGAGSSGANSAD